MISFCPKLLVSTYRGWLQNRLEICVLKCSHDQKVFRLVSWYTSQPWFYQGDCIHRCIKLCLTTKVLVMAHLGLYMYLGGLSHWFRIWKPWVSLTLKSIPSERLKISSRCLLNIPARPGTLCHWKEASEWCGFFQILILHLKPSKYRQSPKWAIKMTFVVQHPIAYVWRYFWKLLNPPKVSLRLENMFLGREKITYGSVTGNPLHPIPRQVQNAVTLSIFLTPP